MKKQYSKPEIAYESFTLSESIAFSCEITDPNDDALKFSDGTYAFTMDANCGTWVAKGDDGEYTESSKYDSICYHVPHGFNLFNS